jgi:hypothetical protein
MSHFDGFKGIIMGRLEIPKSDVKSPSTSSFTLRVNVKANEPKSFDPTR